MGIYVDMLEKAAQDSGLTMEEAIKASEIEKQKNADQFNRYVAAKIRKVESELRQAGVPYDPTELWGKYIALREA